CLQESIHFRLASFLWMDNLAAPDMLLRWGEGLWPFSDPDNMTGSFFSFLYLGPYFNLLPVIAVALMLLQQKMLTPPPAAEQQGQAVQEGEEAGHAVPEGQGLVGGGAQAGAEEVAHFGGVLSRRMS